jgi:hypothetical protein
MEIKNWLSQQQLPLRCDCPVCFHHNTFSAREENGEVFYKCFHADCKIGGKYELDVTLDVLSRYERNNGRTDTNAQSSYVIPEYFCSPLQNKDSLYFLKRWGLLDKYAKGLELYLDPKQNRVVFPLRGFNNELLGCTGRGVSYTINPKWYIYQRLGSCPYQTITYSTERCILVEDAISGIRAGNVCSSIALLGTNIFIEMYKYLEPFDKLVIALDDDATGKAVKLQKELSIIKPTFILPLKKDIKYYSNLEMKDLKKWLDKSLN